MNLDQAIDAVIALYQNLSAIAKRDPEQEVGGIALPVVDADLNAGRAFIPDDDPVVAAISGLIMPEAIAEGEPIRAVGAQIVARQLLAALQRQKPPGRYVH